MFRSSFLRLVRNHLKAPFSTASDAPVLFEYQKNVCKVILNRPKALNALDLEMIRILQAELNKWNQDPNLKVNNLTFKHLKNPCRLLYLQDLVGKVFALVEISNPYMKQR